MEWDRYQGMEIKHRKIVVYFDNPARSVTLYKYSDAIKKYDDLSPIGKTAIGLTAMLYPDFFR